MAVEGVVAEAFGQVEPEPGEELGLASIGSADASQAELAAVDEGEDDVAALDRGEGSEELARGEVEALGLGQAVEGLVEGVGEEANQDVGSDA